MKLRLTKTNIASGKGWAPVYVWHGKDLHAEGRGLVAIGMGEGETFVPVDKIDRLIDVLQRVRRRAS